VGVRDGFAGFSAGLSRLFVEEESFAPQCLETGVLVTTLITGGPHVILMSRLCELTTVSRG